jgi:hypothetical protein
LLGDVGDAMEEGLRWPIELDTWSQTQSLVEDVGGCPQQSAGPGLQALPSVPHPGPALTP